ncbi:uncharacterized protein BDR25DRAFT_85303 [Lindgomyces ingoldianus]|uniref:Uncharacterized protein n=1 Tax=Lindgomyces ingoldianus TaxID=673940 RepID=A0ACB6QFA9_9PLEO|nr:uncharacterized protein BDR25DRAFT_85303 [Lindgomyces ingoldianus]KAF2465587.1 hypothetical protein BDR25DRAFT_85303 [Lindgomyces ingoldianus]
MMGGQLPSSTSSVPAKASKREMEVTDRTKEREFYRYYQKSQPLKADDVPGLQPVARAPSPPLVEPCKPCLSDDPALTAFAQLGALRLNTRRCLISFFDRKTCYILAEATRTLSLQTGEAQFEEDNLCWGTTTFPKQKSICYYTVNLPLDDAGPDYDDFSNIPSLVVNDLSLDARFNDYPFVVGYPYSRFYAGVPIRSPKGHSIGTYCVLDETPRDGISSVDLSFLKGMGYTIMKHLEMKRAAEDHRRGGTMVRSLGSFAEGKASLEEWWQDPWEMEEGGTAGPVETATAPRQRRQTMSSAPTPRPNMEEPVLLNRNDSLDSSNPSVNSPNPTSPGAVAPGSANITPVSEITANSRPSVVATKSASSTIDGTQQDRVSPEVRATFTRATTMILEATEADGAIFFDAKVSTFGGLVEDELAQEQPVDPSEQDKPCIILGESLDKNSATSDDLPSGTYTMTESVLRYLLRAYTHGQIFNFDDDGASEMPGGATAVEPEVQPQLTPLAETLEFLAPKKSESARSQDDENLLREVFPTARSLVLYPLWDAHRDRWYAGAIIWSSDPMRVFTSEQELSYLAAFGNIIMGEVARLDTKLADAAKGDFISSISHELRSPLHGILGSCELLRDTYLDTFQLSTAQTIETCGKTLLDTINHVLDFAKINNLTRGTSKRQKKRSQSSKQVITSSQGHANDIMTLITDVDLSVLTEEVLETVFAGHNFQKSAVKAFQKHKPANDVAPIAVIVDINKSDNYVFRTQPGAWRRVLMNLFGNSLKYTQAGYIKVKLQAGRGSPTDEVSDVRLTISDSGIGMSEDYVNNRIFHSFAQENPLSQGTGLGLSIVKQIVQSLGGDIDVRSQKGYGTKFTVYCPLKLSMMSPTVHAAMPDKDLWSITRRTKGMKVAFVGFDDEMEYFPVKNPKSKNASVLTLKALDSLCTDWFGMRIQHHGSPKATTPDLFVATEAGAKMLRQQYISNPDSAPMSPVISLCQGAASVQSCTAITVPGQIFECVTQPCGPHKLAKALTSCLDRHSNRIMTRSAETDTAIPNVEALSLKENIKAPTLPTGLDTLRPPIMSTLSAPEVLMSPFKSSAINLGQNHHALNCLAVDDNPINLRLLRTFIEKLGHRHSLATNGVEAVDLFKSNRNFDVVLMDINMPEMDGLEAARQIRAHERDTGASPVTIIALTGVASSEAQQEAHVSGINLFLIKPVSIANLEVVLKGVVRG